MSVALAFGAVLAPETFAQPGAAAITGSVRDPSGAAVPEAAVEVINEPRGVHRSLKTGPDGAFSALGLVPATDYRLVVSKPGFSTFQLNQIELQVGSEYKLGVELTISPAETRVSVDESATFTGHHRTEVSGVVGNSQILNLPGGIL